MRSFIMSSVAVARLQDGLQACETDLVIGMRQEIAGTADTMGQYEHHQSFCMPRLYRIVHVRRLLQACLHFPCLA